MNNFIFTKRASDRQKLLGNQKQITSHGSRNLIRPSGAIVSPPSDHPRCRHIIVAGKEIEREIKNKMMPDKLQGTHNYDDDV